MPASNEIGLNGHLSRRSTRRIRAGHATRSGARTVRSASVRPRKRCCAGTGGPRRPHSSPSGESNIWSKWLVGSILAVPWSRPRPIRLPRSGPPSGPGSRRRSRPRRRPRPRAGRPSPQGRHTLIHAPTGSGKTLAAFLWCLDRLVQDPRPAPTQRTARHRPRPLRQPAEGADLRRRAQPPRPPRRHRPRGRPPGRPAAQHLGRHRGPATPPPTSAATSFATRRTSSSRPPRACTSC